MKSSLYYILSRPAALVPSSPVDSVTYLPYLGCNRIGHVYMSPDMRTKFRVDSVFAQFSSPSLSY